MLSVAALAACAVLLAFYLVVTHAVEQGERLRLAMAEQARATWQCKALAGNGAREACLRLVPLPAREKSAALGL